MEKKGLGRGLAALISVPQEEEAPGVSVQQIPLNQISPNPYQPRTVFDPEKLHELADSIQAHGVLQPVLVRRVGHEQYQLIAGERRFRAAQIAKLTTIPALVRELDRQATLEVAIIENVQRADIGPLEAARAYRQLIDEFGMTQESIAKRVGKSRSAIANVLGLLDLPEPLQRSLEDGLVSEGHARAIKVARDEPTMLRILKTVLEDKLSVRETEQLVRGAKEPQEETVTPSLVTFSASAATDAPPVKIVTTPVSNGASRPALSLSDPNESHAVDLMRDALQTKVSIRHTSGGAGRIEIEFYSRHELERLVDLLTQGGR